MDLVCLYRVQKSWPLDPNLSQINPFKQSHRTEAKDNKAGINRRWRLPQQKKQASLQ